MALGKKVNMKDFRERSPHISNGSVTENKKQNKKDPETFES